MILVFPARRFDDPEYLALARKAYPYAEIVRQEMLPVIPPPDCDGDTYAILRKEQ